MYSSSTGTSAPILVLVPVSVRAGASPSSHACIQKQRSSRIFLVRRIGTMPGQYHSDPATWCAFGSTSFPLHVVSPSLAGVACPTAPGTTSSIPICSRSRVATGGLCWTSANACTNEAGFNECCTRNRLGSCRPYFVFVRVDYSPPVLPPLAPPPLPSPPPLPPPPSPSPSPPTPPASPPPRSPPPSPSPSPPLPPHDPIPVANIQWVYKPRQSHYGVRCYSYPTGMYSGGVDYRLGQRASLEECARASGSRRRDALPNRQASQGCGATFEYRSSDGQCNCCRGGYK